MAPTIDLYSWTLEALVIEQGVTILLSQRPTCTTHTHAALFQPHCKSRLLQVTMLNSAAFQSKTCRKDHRLVRKSCLITSITRMPTPWVGEATLSFLDTSADMQGRLTAPHPVTSLLVTLTLSPPCTLPSPPTCTL